MAQDIAFTFYTYSNAGVTAEERWKPTGIPDVFFDSHEEAQRALKEMRADIVADPEMEWPVMNIEKIVTVPVNSESILALLNKGLGSFVQRYEVVESIGPSQ
ncbi:hypothetical protein J5277_17845 [Rhizobium sp. 16-449-1b]|uniref:hypothetical protein n=1 Tax=Rhizobium sp. 16-449-1b TaxID=2819989 RepID=UPI001ADB2BEA|nr:hypothetical protein [Rhizobium sp. 16-449-1b]MBO9195969.1 hypothetical protein [Rhizobium sp. 16-449-1b]